MQFCEFRWKRHVFPQRGLPIPWIPLRRGSREGWFLRSSAKNLDPSPLSGSLAKLIERLKEKLRQTGERARRRATFVTGSRRVLRMLLYVTGNKSSPAAYTNVNRRPSKEFSKLSKACRKDGETLLNIVRIYVYTRVVYRDPFNINPNSRGRTDYPTCITWKPPQSRVRVSRKLWKGRGLIWEGEGKDVWLEKLNLLGR